MSGSLDDPFAQHPARQDDRQPLQLPIVTARYGVRVVTLDAAARQLLSDGSLVLVARGSQSDVLRRKLPTSVALGPVEQIAPPVNVALPGIGMRPLARRPSWLPDAARTAYFELDHFEDAVRSGGIAIHVPPEEWPELELELWAVPRRYDTPTTAPLLRSEGPRRLPLERKKYGVRVALLDDKQLLHRARLVLAAHGPLPAGTLRRLPASARLGPVEQIAQLVNRALPGIALDPLPEAPVELPPVADAVYFELDRTDELFHALDASAAIALHLPPDEWPEELELELWACRPDRGTRTVGDRP